MSVVRAERETFPNAIVDLCYSRIYGRYPSWSTVSTQLQHNAKLRWVDLAILATSLYVRQRT